MFLPLMDQTIISCVPELDETWAGPKNSLKGDGMGIGHNQTMAKLKLSHTPAEHQLYQALLEEADSAHTRLCAFSTRKLMVLAQLPNYSAVRRALHGLINKLSIEDYRITGDMFSSRQATVYLIFSPEEILARRAACAHPGSSSTFETPLDQAIERVADFHGLSRREAQVALCCVEGLTNTEIGRRLHISEQTVKYHLRHIFVKYGVKRRTELVSRLLSHTTQAESISEQVGLIRTPAGPATRSSL